MLRTSSILFASFLAVSSVQAASTSYSSQADFLNDLSGSVVTTADFDGLPAGALIPDGTSLGGATLSYDLGGYSIKIADSYATTSPNNFLGTDDGSDAFYGGDSFTLSFDQSLFAFGLYIISADEIFDGDFTITTNGGQTASSLSIVDLALSDGDAYFLGLIEGDSSLAFTSVTFSSFADDYGFNIDDVSGAAVSAVPEPATYLLMTLGLFGVVGMSRRRNKQLQDHSDQLV